MMRVQGQTFSASNIASICLLCHKCAKETRQEMEKIVPLDEGRSLLNRVYMFEHPSPHLYCYLS